MTKPLVSAVAAISYGPARSRALGSDNELLWRIPDDLKRFRDLTRGHPVIMGRKTFDSIVAVRGGPLPDRTNIVVTRKAPAFTDFGDTVIVVSSIEEAIEKAKMLEEKEIFVIGGGQIYELALPHTDKLYLTLVDADKDGDAHFPAFEDAFTKKTFEESHEWEGLRYQWIDLERES